MISLLAARNAQIAPFYVMEVMKEAARLEAAGRPVIHLSIGEPDFTAPEPVRRAAIAAIESGRTQYTPAVGLPALRRAIAQHYRERFGAHVDPGRIVITAGASGALLLALAALVERDAEVLMADPSYPCNRNFVTAFEGRAQLVACGPQSRFQLTADHVAAHWTTATRGVLIASPSNPTGTSIAPAALDALLAEVRARGGFVIVDEIYQGLTYGHAPTTVLTSASAADHVVVINSFSKYFSMTGWRLGWLAVPEPLVPTIEKLAQNLFICASAVAQQAGLACFTPESMAVYEERHREFQRRRDYLVPALQALGLEVPVVPDGAFYVYADVSRFTDDSTAFAFDVLHEADICLVPGRDFGVAQTQKYVRLSYATALANIEEAIERLRRFLAGRQRKRAAG
jgi:aspartate/methionine/tyrosine aminotransferase